MRYMSKIVNFRVTPDEYELLKLAAGAFEFRGSISALISKSIKPHIDEQRRLRADRLAKATPVEYAAAKTAKIDTFKLPPSSTPAKESKKPAAKKKAKV